MVTAVQWLKTVIEFMGDLNIEEALEEALTMEREQIEEAFMSGKLDWNNHIENNQESEDSSVYYDKNYGNDNGE